jgi:hypothetical protein
MENVTTEVTAMVEAAKAEWATKSRRAWDGFDMAKALTKKGIKVHCTGFAMFKHSADKVVTIQARHLENNMGSCTFYKV